MNPVDQKKPTPKYTAEFRERGVRLFREQRPEYTSDNAAYRAIASSLAVPTTLFAPGAFRRPVTLASVSA